MPSNRHRSAKPASGLGHTGRRVRLSGVLLTAVFVWLALAAPGLSADEQAVEVIRITHRTARDFLPLVTPLLGPDGHVSADTRSNSLVVVETPDRIAKIRAFVTEMDRPVQRLRVAFQFSADESQTESGVEADIRIKTGDDTITVGKPGVEGTEIRVFSDRRRYLKSGDFFITLDSGGESTLMVGTDVPYRDRWEGICRRYGFIARTVEFVRVDTGFSVQAIAMGNRVRVDVAPAIAFHTRSGYERSQRFADAETTLTVAMGEWVTLAGTDTQTHDVTRAVLDSVRRSEESEIVMRLRVDPF